MSTEIILITIQTVNKIVIYSWNWHVQCRIVTKLQTIYSTIFILPEWTLTETTRFNKKESI